MAERLPRRPHNPKDVSNGREKIRIPWGIEACASIRGEQQGQRAHRGEKRGAGGGTEDIPAGPPLEWKYMAVNTPHEKARINRAMDSMVAGTCRECEGCCVQDLDNSPFCSCKESSNGAFAYNEDGLLTPEFLKKAIAEHCGWSQDSPRSGGGAHRYHYCEDRAKCYFVAPGEKNTTCPGHINRTFIKECWSLCGCDYDCRNRVVQKGITRPLELRYFGKGKGWGVRSVEAIPKGAFVLEYAGEVMTNAEQEARNKQRARDGQMTQHFAVQLDACYASERVASDKEALVLDATYMGNLGRFINHECGTANLVDIPVEYDCAQRNYYHVAFFATRDIKAGEELTWDYENFLQDDSDGIPSFDCHCNSPECRNPASAAGGAGPKSRARDGKGVKKQRS